MALQASTIDILAWRIARSQLRIAAKIANADIEEMWSRDFQMHYDDWLDILNSPSDRVYQQKLCNGADRLAKKGQGRRRKAEIVPFQSK